MANRIPPFPAQRRFTPSPAHPALLILALMALLPGLLCASAVVADAAPGLSAGPGGVVLRGGKPWRGIGVNYFDCFLRTLANGDDTSYEAGFAELARRGIPFARFCATGFWPRDMELYQKNRDAYFRRLDGVVRSAERHGVGLVPSLFWYFPCVPDLAGEPAGSWGVRGSRTQAWMREYVREVVGRYRASPALWFWELGNEYNLVVDLPSGPAHRPKIVPGRGTPATRSEKDELRLEQLREAVASFATAVRELDPHRLIVTGHSMPRPSAWHLARERTWKKDDEAQFAEILEAQTPAPVDALCVHVYSDEDVARLPWLARASVRSGRPAFVGEFGVKVDERPDSARRAAFAAMLRALADGAFPISALWVYDYPKQKEWNVTAANERGWQLDAVAAANRELRGGSAQ